MLPLFSVYNYLAGVRAETPPPRYIMVKDSGWVQT